MVPSAPRPTRRWPYRLMECSTSLRSTSPPGLLSPSRAMRPTRRSRCSPVAMSPSPARLMRTHRRVARVRLERSSGTTAELEGLEDSTEVVEGTDSFHPSAGPASVPEGVGVQLSLMQLSPGLPDSEEAGVGLVAQARTEVRVAGASRLREELHMERRPCSRSSGAQAAVEAARPPGSRGPAAVAGVEAYSSQRQAPSR